MHCGWMSRAWSPHRQGQRLPNVHVECVSRALWPLGFSMYRRIAGCVCAVAELVRNRLRARCVRFVRYKSALPDIALVSMLRDIQSMTPLRIWCVLPFAWDIWVVGHFWIARQL